MIEIVMTGICEGCKHANLTLDYVLSDSFDSSNSNIDWQIFCTHQEACEAMMEKVREVTE